MSSMNGADTHSYEALTSETIPTAPPHSFPLYHVPPVPLGYNGPSDAQMWKVPTVAPQWSFAAVIPQITESSAFYKTFLKGKPKALGIVLILAAILQVLVGIGLIFTTFSVSLPSGIPFWGPIIYIIAGSLTIAAQAKPSICLIKGSLSMNILTITFSVIGLVLTCVDLGFIWCYPSRLCRSRIIGGYFIDAILIVTNLLLFCLSISLSVFGCRSLNHASSIVPQVFVIQNDVVISMPPSVFSATAPTFPQTQPPPPASPPPYTDQIEDNVKQFA
ncbi:membrane-spanning 4-domains subfamily A member 4D-like isoform X1 [Phyllobates terribilis]|uniref:membrane-spanning 4-domains subfamily A member 4D-like isoform X1 n=1 Tax=Phyllobates terribilis TaxID=111132 RepID=UPI003CCAD6A0